MSKPLSSNNPASVCTIVIYCRASYTVRYSSAVGSIKHYWKPHWPHWPHDWPLYARLLVCYEGGLSMTLYTAAAAVATRGCSIIIHPRPAAVAAHGKQLLHGHSRRWHTSFLKAGVRICEILCEFLGAFYTWTQFYNVTTSLACRHIVGLVIPEATVNT